MVIFQGMGFPATVYVRNEQEATAAGCMGSILAIIKYQDIKTY